MPPMLNSSATDAHMSPPPSPLKPDVNYSSFNTHDLGSVLLEMLQQRVALTSLRSLLSCTGIGETEPFNLPPQHRMITRMKINTNYFLTNYVLLLVGVFAFLLLFFHPIQLFVCVILVYGWHVFLTKKEIPTKFELFGRRLSEQDILLAATGSTLVFLLFFILPTIIFAVSVSSLASATHALLRNNRLKDDSIESRHESAASSEMEELV